MTDQVPSLRPDARLVSLHAERGDPQARLEGALAALEGADWGLLLRGEEALARQLAALLGRGTVRIDPRVPVSRAALAEAGLAAASLDADWRGARAVWLLEPSEDDLDRARRAGVSVIVDATLAPGGGWLGAGAALLTYRDSVTLTGYGDAPLSALFGAGPRPQPVAEAPADLSVALALRDVATLPLRLARAARTVAVLAERLGGAAQPAGPTALLLAPDAAANTAHGLGGVMAAARSVPGGVLLTPGLNDPEQTLQLLAAAPALADTQPPSRPAPESAERPRAHEERRPEERRPDERRSDDRRHDDRRDRFRGSGRGGGRRSEGRGGRPDFASGGERPQPDRPDRPQFPDRAQTPDVPERFVFEAPEQPVAQAGAGEMAQSPSRPAATPAPQAEQPEETWEPEIVFSDIAQGPVRLPTPVSSGPDAPNLEVLPDVRPHPESEAGALPDFQDSAPGDEPVTRPEQGHPEQSRPEHSRPERDRSARGQGNRDRRGNAPTPEAEPEAASPAETLAPDLPGSREDPAQDLTEEQAAVYARLREWRNAEAKRQEISRFIVASNATLAEIARRVPYTEADLRAVKGMGPERLRKYGEKILDVVRG